MQLNPVASTVVVAFFLVLSVILVGLLGAFVVFLARLNAKLEEITTRVDPLLTRTEALMAEANDRLNTIGDKAEVILTQGEAVATSVHDKVDRTATAVTRTVNAPLIRINSLAAGLTAGWEAFARRPSRHRNGSNSSYAMTTPTSPYDARPAEATPVTAESPMPPASRSAEPEKEEIRELAEARVGTVS